MWFGGSTFIKLVMKDDGGPNWFGIAVLGIIFLVIFWWRCCTWVPENWIAIRRRFNRIVRNEDGSPLEYDPLMDHPNKPGKKVRNFRFRFYMVNSLVLVNCGTRETNLDIDAVTLGDMDFDTVFSWAWNVSRLPGNPTKSFLAPAETKWRWRSEKDELEQLVRKYAADAVVKAYEEKGAKLGKGRKLRKSPKQLPLLDFEKNASLKAVTSFLLEEYGVQSNGLLYGRRSVAPARRVLQGLTAIADALLARLKSSESSEDIDDEEIGAAAASSAAVIELHAHH